MSSNAPALLAGPSVRLTEIGRGEAVVLLHGTAVASTTFRPIADALAERYRFFLVDPPGYRGVPEVGPFSPLHDVHLAIEDALIARGCRRVALVGLSLGAWRALHIALTSRLDVVGVVTLGGLARLTPEHAEGLLKLAADMRLMESLDNPGFIGTCADAYLSPGGRAVPEWMEAVRECARAATPVAVARELEAIAAEPPLRGLETLRCPVVARVGTLDVATPLSYSQEIVDKVPGARLEVVPGKAHLLNVEDVEGTTASIAAALDSWFGSSR